MEETPIWEFLLPYWQVCASRCCSDVTVSYLTCDKCWLIVPLLLAFCPSPRPLWQLILEGTGEFGHVVTGYLWGLGINSVVRSVLCQSSVTTVQSFAFQVWLKACNFTHKYASLATYQASAAIQFGSYDHFYAAMAISTDPCGLEFLTGSHEGLSCITTNNSMPSFFHQPEIRHWYAWNQTYLSRTGPKAAVRCFQLSRL